MPELRKDPVVGRWVIIATERARRPGTMVDFQKNYPLDIRKNLFDPARAKDIYRAGKDSNVRVVSCCQPLLELNTEMHRREHGLYTIIEGYGAHEIVIEAANAIVHMADMDVEEITSAIETYCLRLEALSQNQNLKYAFLYKNYNGGSAEEKNPSHSQILASPVIPLHIKEELDEARDYFAKTNRSVYADILKQELKDKVRLVKESADFVVFTPFASRFPFEMMLMPKDLNCDFSVGIRGKEKDLAQVLKDILMKIRYGLEDPAFDLVLNTAPFRHKGKNGERWQTIEKDFCWHLEIVPRLTYVAGFEKGTGFNICPIPPEKTAEFLNQVELENLI